MWKKVKKGAKKIGKSCEKAAKYVYKKAKKALSGKNVQRLVIGSVVIIGTGLVVSATGGAGLAVSGQILKISLACGAAEGAYQGLKYRIKHGKKYGKIRKKAFDGFTTGYATGAIIFSVFPSGKIGSGSWRRNLKNTGELNVNDFYSLKDNGVVKVNTSGSDRPLTGAPNSYYKTGKGEHIFIYDNEGKLIYDISSSRVKSFKINVDPKGGEHYQAYKLDGVVPDAIKKLFGWWWIWWT